MFAWNQMKGVVLLNLTIRRGGRSWGPSRRDTKASQHKSWEFIAILLIFMVLIPHNINRENFLMIFMIFTVLSLVTLDTPILGSRMPMRRETLKAIETARDNLMQVRLLLLISSEGATDHVLLLSNNNFQFFRFNTLIVAQERKQSKMRTLGASNPHNNNKDKHRANTRYLFWPNFFMPLYF